MILDRYFFRRVEKFIKTKVIAWSYHDLPFDIYWADAPYDVLENPDNIICTYHTGDRVYFIIKK